jgi:hypothetical protein
MASGSADLIALLVHGSSGVAFAVGLDVHIGLTVWGLAIDFACVFTCKCCGRGDKAKKNNE